MALVPFFGRGVLLLVLRSRVVLRGRVVLRLGVRRDSVMWRLGMLLWSGVAYLSALIPSGMAGRRPIAMLGAHRPVVAAGARHGLRHRP